MQLLRSKEQRDQKRVKRKHVEQILQRVKHDIANSERALFCLTLTQDIHTVFSIADQLLHAHAPTIQLGANDALHIATAVQLTNALQKQVILVTSDGGRKRGENLKKMKAVCEKIELPFYDPCDIDLP